MSAAVEIAPASRTIRSVAAKRKPNAAGSRREALERAANAFLREHGEGRLANDQSDRAERRRRRLHAPSPTQEIEVGTLRDFASDEFELRFRSRWENVRLPQFAAQPTDPRLRRDAWRAALIRAVDRWGLRFQVERGGRRVWLPLPPRPGGEKHRWHRADTMTVIAGDYFLDETDFALVAILEGRVRARSDEEFRDTLERETAAMRKALQRHGRPKVVRGPRPAKRYPRPLG